MWSVWQTQLKILNIDLENCKYIQLLFNINKIFYFKILSFLNNYKETIKVFGDN